MHTRLTLILISLLFPILVSGCGSSTPTTPNILVLSVYAGVTTGNMPTQQWKLTDAAFVQKIYAHILVLHQCHPCGGGKRHAPAWHYVFQQNDTVILTASTGPLQGTTLRISGKDNGYEVDGIFNLLKDQVICSQTPNTTYCPNPASVPTLTP